MARSVSALIVVTLSISDALAQRTSSPTVLQQAAFQGSTYYLLSESSWPDAQHAAANLGGHLATVDSLEEDTFLLDSFSATVSSLAADGIVSLWIGLNDANLEGIYQWVSGSSAPYRNWNPGQPQNGPADEDYAAILVKGFGTSGRWHDVVLDTRYNDRTFGVVEGLSEVAGDYNSDGTVDAADYTVWRDNVGAPAGTLPNDPAGGTIGPTHYTQWVQNYAALSSSTAFSRSASVPEPGAAVLMALAAATRFGTRSRSRDRVLSGFPVNVACVFGVLGVVVVGVSDSPAASQTVPTRDDSAG